MAYRRQQVCAGAAGAAAAALVGVPAECLKHRVQLQIEGYTTPAAALSSTLCVEGVRGLYRGLSSTLARNIPYNALHFGTFALVAGTLRPARVPAADALAGKLVASRLVLLPPTEAAFATLRPHTLPRSPALHPPTHTPTHPPTRPPTHPNSHSNPAGALAGTLTAMITTPLDLVNTRLQTQRVLRSILRISRATKQTKL